MRCLFSALMLKSVTVTGRGWLFSGILAGVGGILLPGSAGAAEFKQSQAPWEQAAPTFGVVLGVERDVYSFDDKAGRFVLAVQCGKGRKADHLEGRWAVSHAGQEIARGEGSLAEGMLVVDHDLVGLKPGDYEIVGEVWGQSGKLAEQRRSFQLIAGQSPTPPREGRVPLIVPAGVPATASGYPVSLGVPFPRGVLSDLSQLRVIDEGGREIPAQFEVRSQWARVPEAGVRWLGVDVRLPETAAWWPGRQQTPLYLEYGRSAGSKPEHQVKAVQGEEGIRVDTGILSFLVRREGYNLLDEVHLHGKPVLNQGGKGGAYLIDQEGAVYRAANDREPQLTIEENGPLRSVVRVEGWYVKDKTSGKERNFRLPTEALCRFITRIEAYAGLPWVRVLHQWINTSDSYHVSFQDIGFILERPNNRMAAFGELDSTPQEVNVQKDGAYLVQHLSDRFDLCRPDDSLIKQGAKSDGSVQVTSSESGLLSIAHRDTWQRFPKEIEVLPGEVRLHIWPKHGRTHPEIDPYGRSTYHQLWFAHQGKQLDLRFPWETLFTVMRFADDPSTGIYQPASSAMGGVHSSAMGIALTSDFMIRFGDNEEKEAARQDIAAFNAQPTMLAHPDWLNRSRVLGPVHPYDPKRFKTLEQAAEDTLLGMWELQDRTGEYGMFLYRGWHHNRHMGEGFWEPYRLYTAGHHYEPYLPWLYFARSGNPRYSEIGMATMRHFTDLGIIHHADPNYEHVEFHSRQKRLVGSTRHSNGFVLWGGDHAILGHLTSYGAILTAYYMTGDLRLREVVVDEWQKTLLADRLNPQWDLASRHNRSPKGGRDNNQPLGEMLDLYQHTYDPRLLALIQPCMEAMEKNMVRWSRELPTVLDFRRTPKLKNQLIEAVDAHWLDAQTSLYSAVTYLALPQRYALAAWIKPGKGYAKGVFSGDFEQKLIGLGKGFRNWEKPSEPAWLISDYTLDLPLAMSAIVETELVKSNESGGLRQQLPYASELGGNKDTRIIVKEESDEPIVLTFAGKIQSSTARVRVFDQQGSLLADERLPAGEKATVTIPADGIVGEYTIQACFQSGEDMIHLPISSLKREVYITEYWINPANNSFFMGVPNREDGTVEFASGKNAFLLKSASGETVGSHRVSDYDPAKPTRIPFPEGGLWFHSTKGRYFNTPKGHPVIFSLSPENFFKPEVIRPLVP